MRNKRLKLAAKWVLGWLIAACLVGILAMNVRAEDGSVQVYITVSDVTDYTHPLNVLVERRKITVTEFDMTQYSDNLKNLGTLTASGPTYMHALVQLHIELYGTDPAVLQDKIAVDENGITRYFLGRAAADVMYRNGNEITALPQDVTLVDGDELQVCLYNANMMQGIATFENAKIQANANTPIALKLYEHFESPIDRIPLPEAEIVDENGLYILDGSGNVIETDINGNATVSFSSPGTYIISTAPQINYYMEPADGEYITYYDKVTTITPITKEVHVLTGKKPTSQTVESMQALWDELESGEDSAFEKSAWSGIFWVDWTYDEVDPSICDVYMTDYAGVHVKSVSNADGTFTVSGEDLITRTDYRDDYEITAEIVERKEPAKDELLPAVSYTLPYCVIEIEAYFEADAPTVWFGDASAVVDTFTSTLRNTQPEYGVGEDDVAIAAAYSADGRFLGVQWETIQGKDSVSFTFAKSLGAATYKLFFWDSVESMKPIPNASTTQSADPYCFTSN